jgi:aspartate/methionine/tyrosine aminotransferase
MFRAAAMDLAEPHSPVIHLEVGQPNFSTPPHIVEATVQALRDGHTAYAPSSGELPLRQAIADKYSNLGFPTALEQIVVTVGSSLSLFSILSALLQPGDECLLPLPGYPNWQANVSLLGARSVPYLCAPAAGFLPALADIRRQATPRTRCIILCSPGNPTGAVIPRELFRSILHWAHAENIFVISDGRHRACLGSAYVAYPTYPHK